jgi:hypothetical protein
MRRNVGSVVTVGECKVSPRSALGRLIKEIKHNQELGRRRSKRNVGRAQGETYYSEYVEKGYGETPYHEY